MGNLPSSLDNEILELCKQGKKMSAIKTKVMQTEVTAIIEMKNY